MPYIGPLLTLPAPNQGHRLLQQGGNGLSYLDVKSLKLPVITYVPSSQDDK
jgi:hypothetical protein